MSRVHQAEARKKDGSDDPAVRVVVVDDHPVYRAGIARAVSGHPRLELVGEAADGAAAVALLREVVPDVVLLDVQLPALDGPNVLQTLVRNGSPTRVVFLSAFAEGAVVYEALAAGAAGYLAKGAEEGEICQAVIAAASGETVVSAELQGAVFGQVRQHAQRTSAALSAREREILAMVAEGKQGTEIAKALFVAQGTVKTYMQRIFEKLGVNDRSAAVAEAMRRGLLE